LQSELHLCFSPAAIATTGSGMLRLLAPGAEAAASSVPHPLSALAASATSRLGLGAGTQLTVPSVARTTACSQPTAASVTPVASSAQHHDSYCGLSSEQAKKLPHACAAWHVHVLRSMQGLTFQCKRLRGCFSSFVRAIQCPTGMADQHAACSDGTRDAKSCRQRECQSRDLLAV